MQPARGQGAAGHPTGNMLPCNGDTVLTAGTVDAARPPRGFALEGLAVTFIAGAILGWAVFGSAFLGSTFLLIIFLTLAGTRLISQHHMRQMWQAKQTVYNVGTAVAKYEYAAIESNQLSMVAGEQFKILDDSHKWFRVRNSVGEEGLVPSNYLVIKKSS